MSEPKRLLSTSPPTSAFGAILPSGALSEFLRRLRSDRRGRHPLSIEFDNGPPPGLRELAQEAVDHHRMRRLVAARTVIARLNQLLAASGAKCRILTPEEPVESVTDAASGQLIYRCGHDPAHRWYLDGRPIP
jgi:hypothetical protein